MTKPLHTPADNRRRAAFDPNISAVKLAAQTANDDALEQYKNLTFADFLALRDKLATLSPPLSLANLVQAQGARQEVKP